MDFRLWLEQSKQRPIVFSDLDETLVHTMEVGWLKDSKKNKNYAKILVTGRNPLEKVKLIKNEKGSSHVFPRPGLEDFLKNVNSFADLYILTHSNGKYAESVVKGLGIGKYVKGIFHTGDQEPGSLSRKFNLTDRSWILIDNLNIETVEIINKLRILGLGSNYSPDQESKIVVRDAKDHFVQVKDWIPKVEENKDFELSHALEKIKSILKN